jgi:hypothetical protein
LQQFVTDSHVAANGIVVVKLIGPEGIRLVRENCNLLLEPFEQGRRHFPTIARHDSQLSAESLHRQQFFARKRIRGEHDEPIAFGRAYHGQRGAGAAAREFNDAHAWPQKTARFGAFDHRDRHAIFVRTRRVHGFQLDEHFGAGGRHDPSQTHDGRFTNRPQHRVGSGSHRHGSEPITAQAG